jgi:hypothetical protein
MIERARKRLSKRVKRGFRGYPIPTVALYGLDWTAANRDKEQQKVKIPPRRKPTIETPAAPKAAKKERTATSAPRPASMTGPIAADRHVETSR